MSKIEVRSVTSFLKLPVEIRALLHFLGPCVTQIERVSDKPEISLT